MEAEKAMDVANILVEGDLMEHTTHGLQMLVPYLKSMESGEMTLSGNYSVIKDTGNNIVI